ncbi:MAG: hypothetical protein JXA69_00605 [Phycisphaerae bacterium]|nr:hypothetical protein [Phycisphaerae bacterium]
MRYRFNHNTWILFGLAALAIVAVATQTARAQEPDAQTVEEQRAQMAEIVEQMQSKVTKDAPAEEPAEVPAEPTVEPEPAPAEPPAGERIRQRRPGRPAEPVTTESPGVPTSQPSPEEILTGSSLDKLDEVPEGDLDALRAKIRKDQKEHPRPKPSPPSPAATESPAAESQPADASGTATDERLWEVPPEDRKYFFTWYDQTQLEDACEDFARMAGLSLVGAEVITGAKPFKYKSAETMTFDEALNELNLILREQQYWLIRQDAHLFVRKLTDWHRHIPEDRYYASVQAYHDAKLPLWEILSVNFECTKASPPALAEFILRQVPDNTVHALPLEGTNKVGITGVAYYVERALKLADDYERDADQDGRTLEIYTVKYVEASEAATILREMVNIPSVTGSRATPVPRPGQPPTPAPGSSSVEAVDITPQDDMRRLIVRATPLKHAEIAEALKTIDVDLPPDDRLIKEIQLKHISAQEAIDLIKPLVGRTKTVVRQLPPRVMQPGQPPQQPPPQIITQPDPNAPELFADNNRNVIIVRCQEKEFLQIEELAVQFDVETEAGHKVVEVKHADASQIASTAAQIIAGSQRPRPGVNQQIFRAVAAPNGSAVVITGSTADVASAERLIGELDVETTLRTETYPLTYAAADEIVSFLQQAAMTKQGNRFTANRPQFTADSRTNSIVVAGTDEYHTLTKELISQLDIEREDGMKDHLVKLTNADPQTLAQILQQKFTGTSSPWGRSRSTGAGQPQFIPDSSSGMLLVRANDRQWPSIESMLKEFDDASVTQPRPEIYRLQHASADEIVTLLRSAVQSRRPGRAYTPPPQFAPNAKTNAILVTAVDEDHETIKMLLGELDQQGYDQLQEIPLEHADADFVADKLRELLEVDDSQSRYWRGSTGAEIRILAEPLSNKLLVAAPPDKFEQARQYAAAIDADYAKAGYEERVFTLKNTDSWTVTSAVSQIILGQDQRSRWGTPTNTGGTKIVDVNGAIVVRAPKEKMEQIATLIETLDAEGTSSNEIRSWHLPGADVYDIARTISQLFPYNYRDRTRVQCTADTSSETLFVSAPKDKMEQIVQHIETIQTHAPKESPFSVRYFALTHVRADDIRDTVEEILDRKWDVDQAKRSRGSRSMGLSPRVEADASGKRLIIATSEDLMPLADELIKELDVASEFGESVVRIIALQKGKAEELAPLIETAANADDKSGGSSRSRRSFFRYMYTGMQSSSGEPGSVSITAIPQSNSLLLRGPEEKVEKATRLAEEIDAEARPEGPVIKTYVLKFADVYEVQDMIKGLLGGETVGGFDDWSSDYSSSSSSRRGRGSSGTLLVSADYMNNMLLVAADYEKIPQVDNLVQLKESLAEARKADLDTTTKDGMIATGEGLFMKTIDLSEKVDAEDVADRLEDVLWDVYGYWDAPDVRAMRYTNSIIITAKGDKLKAAEGYLDRIVKDWRSKTIVVVKQVEGLPASKLADFLKTYGAGLQSEPEFRRVDQYDRMKDPERIIQEVPIFIPGSEPPAETTTTTTTHPFVPTAELSRLRAALASLPLTQAPTTQPAATRPAKPVATQPAQPTPAPKTAPAKPEAKPAPAPKPVPAKAEPKPAPVPTATPAKTEASPSPAVKAEPAPAPKAAPAKPEAEPKPAPAAPVQADDTPPSMIDNVWNAAEALKESGRPQIMIDDMENTMIIVGQPKQVEELQELIKALEDQLESLPKTTDIRVFKLSYVNVNVAATILEQMFNEGRTAQAAQQAQQARQQAQQQAQQARQQQGAQQAREGDQSRSRGEDGEGRDRRPDRERREGEEEQAGDGPRPLLRGDRIRVFPDVRTRTLVIRAHPDDYREIAELLLKIDRPSDDPGIQIRIFQLEKLNAGEVEDALKAILKIDDRQGPRATRMPRGGVPGAAGQWQQASSMIEQLQEQVLDLQAGPGKTSINPSEQITITSDATTNSVIVVAPDDGMKLVEELINKLEEKPVPLEIRTITLNNADVGDVLPHLEKTFQGTAGRRGGGDGESVTPARIGAVQFAGDVRTNQLVIRALKPDFERIEAVVKELDKKLEDEQVVQTFTLEYADASGLAKALMDTYTSGQAAREVGKSIRISADQTSNTLFVWAPKVLRTKIETQVLALDQDARGKFEPKQLALKQADAAVVADKLTAAFGSRGGRGKMQVKITGDTASGMLLVTAPPDVFEQIKKTAEAMDMQKTLMVRPFKLEHAYAIEVVDQFKDMIMQLARQLRPGSGIDMGVIAITPDSRTNTLFVVGSAQTMAIAETVIKTVDVLPPDPVVQKTHYFYLTKAQATSVAATINSLYADVPGKSVPPPKAYAEPLTNAVFVYATTPQINEIKASVIDPLEQISPEGEQELGTHHITLEHAKVDDVMTTVTSYVTQRQTALRTAGVQRNLKPQDMAISLTSDTNTNQLIVYCSKANLEDITNLVKTLDTPETTANVRETKVYPVRFADIYGVTNALTAALTKPGRVSEKDRVTVVPEAGTQSIVVTASAENIAQADKIIAELDTETGQERITEQIALKNASATDVATTITNLLAQTRRRTRSTGQLPATLQAIASTNTILINAPKDEIEQVKELVTSLDVPGIEDADMEVRTFRLTYVEPSSLSNAINMAFRSRTGQQNPRDVVISTSDYTSGTLIVSASKEQMAKVETLVKDMDQESETKRPVRVLELTNAEAADVARSLQQVFMYSGGRIRQGQFAVQIQHITGTDRLLVQADDSQYAEIQAIVKELDVPDLGKMDEMQVVMLEHVDASETLTILQEFLRKTGSSSPRGALTGDVRVAASSSSNAIVISGGNEQVQHVVDLIRKLDNEVEGANAPQIVKLEVANAAQLANTLSQVFTDPARQQRTRQTPGSIPVILADDRTNSLIIRARPADFNLIQGMVKDMDQQTDETLGTIKLVSVAQGINVTNLAAQIEQTINTGQRYMATQTGTKPLQISIGADERTNSLLVSGSPALYPEVEKLVAQLEKMKPPGGTGVLIVPLKNVRPDDVKRVIDQLQQQQQGSRGRSYRRSAADLEHAEINEALRHSA